MVRRSLRALAAVAVLAAVSGAAWAGYRWLVSSPRFAITAITVDGAHRVDADELRAALPIRPGDNVFVDLAAIARAARANPWIASATAHRILPHTIAIEVREHTAAAAIELGELYLVDADGHPFKRADLAAGDGDGLPVLTGVDRAAYAADPEAAAATARDALAAYAGWRDAERSGAEAGPLRSVTRGRPAIGEIHVDAHRAVTLRTYDHAVAIQLGALGPGLAARLHTFDTAWAGLSDAERARARAVHLDARPDHVIVAFAKD